MEAESSLPSLENNKSHNIPSSTEVHKSDAYNSVDDQSSYAQDNGSIAATNKDNLSPLPSYESIDITNNTLPPLLSYESIEMTNKDTLPPLLSYESIEITNEEKLPPLLSYESINVTNESESAEPPDVKSNEEDNDASSFEEDVLVADTGGI